MKVRRRVLISLVLALSVIGAGAVDQWRRSARALEKTIVGQARVVDGDSLEIDGRAIRLLGLDAPELKQECGDGYPCGLAAKQALVDLIAGDVVTCVVDRADRYQRQLAVCTVGQLDLAQQLVSLGWAIIDERFPSDYHLSLRRAKSQNHGIFAHGGLTSPRRFREDSQQEERFSFLRKLLRTLQK